MRTTHHQRRGLYAPELLEARIAPATIIVNSLLDDGDGANTTLREAITLANDPATHPGADTIVFQISGLLLPGTIVLNGTEILITDTLTIKGLGIDLLSVSGNDLSSIFKINDGTTALKPTTISGLTLTNGKSASYGGAIYSVEPLTLKNVVVRNSNAGTDGGGVWVNTTGKISIAGSRIVHNAAGSDGGGLYLASTSSISVVKTTIADNTASDAGGGLSAKGLGPKSIVVIDTSLIANNTATTDDGGGLKLAGPDDGMITVKNSLITGNRAGDDGGGLYLDKGNFLVTNSTFSRNTAPKAGAIADDGARSLTISGSRFLGNSATDAASPGGGALYLFGPSTVKISSSLFSRNTAASSGGAIRTANGPTVTVTGSSFLGNSAPDYGGAIFLAGATQLTLKSSTLSGNFADLAGGAIYAGFASVLNLTGNKFTENGALDGGAIFLDGLAGAASTANLSGNLFQANVAESTGGAVAAQEDCIFTSKADKFIGNLARTGQGGGVHLVNAGGILVTGSLFQRNVSGDSGGGVFIGAGATLTSVKILDNIAGVGARGGGLRISAGPVVIAKSVITGNIANDGGGVFYNVGTTTFDAATRAATKGNAALGNPNLGRA